MERVPLNNVQRLARNRQVNVNMFYDLDKHKYRDASGVHYIPYNAGRNKSKMLRRINNTNEKHHTLYKRKYY